MFKVRDKNTVINAVSQVPIVVFADGTYYFRCALTKDVMEAILPHLQRHSSTGSFLKERWWPWTLLEWLALTEIPELEGEWWIDQYTYHIMNGSLVIIVKHPNGSQQEHTFETLFKYHRYKAGQRLGVRCTLSTE